MRRTPALIIGGGPAGATAALLLARAGQPHLLLERQRDVGDALCGGFVSWRTLETLDALGIEADALNRERVTRTRVFAGTAVIEARLPAPAVGVSRGRLDTLLLSLARRAGAAIAVGVTVRSLADGIARLADGGEIGADRVLLSTGKHDLRGWQRVAPEPDPMLGLRIRLPDAPGVRRLIGDAIELHLFPGGYAGVVRQEDGANVCMAVRRSTMTRAGGPAGLLEALGRAHPHLGERLAMATGAIDAVANVPYGWRATSGCADLLRLGDQAAVIPSLAGEGIDIALQSAIRAVAAIEHGPAAAARFQPAFARHARRPMLAAAMVARLAQSGLAPWAISGLAPALPTLAKLTRLPRASLDAAGSTTDIATSWIA